ncbi:hypothetical protein NW768_002439 [Fusarium equiseti]|uniref:Uncharacterized protein n=1 Tax=Fusarium equiseti TaxID=61235 RepID=A0ABQ8RNN5_FUSEQ|nr:hypothetical protein NW768_002439 [Fusarium equiseti]
MSNDQSNVEQATNAEYQRVGQQISVHQADGKTSTWITMDVRSTAPITMNAFTTAPMTINAYAGTAIKINVVDPPTSGQIAGLQNREVSEVIGVDTTEETGKTDNLSEHIFQHVHWTPSGYVEDDLSAVGHETAVKSLSGVESDSPDEGEPWESNSDDSDEEEDEDNNRSTTAEIGEPSESNLPTSGNSSNLTSYLRPVSNYPFFPISTNFIKCGIESSRQQGSAWKRSVLRVETPPLNGSRPTYSWHWPDANGRFPVSSWEFVLVCMRETTFQELCEVGLPTKRCSWDRYLNVDISGTIDLQPDFTLPERAGWRVIAWAKQPSVGGTWHWLDFQGRVVEETADFEENHDP